jgi:ATP adenylyltransferase
MFCLYQFLEVRMLECAFCKLVRPPSGNAEASVTGLEMQRVVVAESENFIVLLDIAPLIHGHCLMISKFHIPAYLFLVGKEPVWSEFQVLLNYLRRRISGIYGVDPMLFEHGVSWASDPDSCCINHAHLHLLPTRVDVRKELDATNLRLISVGDYSVAAPSVGDIPYFFYQASSQVGLFYDANGAPSQHLRRLVGEQLESNLWNWRDYILLADEQELRRRLARVQVLFREQG